MGKFTSKKVAPRSPVTTKGVTKTYEGGKAYIRDPRSELFIFAATNMVGEDTFYEGASDRDERFRQFIWDVTREDPDWVARFVPFLRNEMHMRSASIVMAAESAMARNHHKIWLDPKVTISTRHLVSSAMSRADEPGEFVAYWRWRGNKSVPGGVQRGLGDAVTRLYNEYSALKYDGSGHPWRMIDVVTLAKPHPVGAWQNDLFDFLADKRWKRDEIRVTERLPRITTNRDFVELPPDERRRRFLENPEELGKAGMTWETFSSLGPMDKAAWEAMIPHMGYMALLRNLRNFDEADVSNEVTDTVAEKLADPEKVAKSRQFPYRFMSAYKAAPGVRWSHALDKALTHSVRNIPALSGRTLVLVDTSGSMSCSVSQKSTVTHAEIGALFGVALAKAGANVELRGFATDLDTPFQITKGGSLIRDVERFQGRIGVVGHGTEMAGALKRSFKGHDRVILISDMQAFSDWRGSPSDVVPANTPFFGVNTTGYKATAIESSKPNRYEIGGFSDRLFTMVDLLSRGEDAGWPF